MPQFEVKTTEKFVMNCLYRINAADEAHAEQLVRSGSVAYDQYTLSETPSTIVSVDEIDEIPPDPSEVARLAALKTVAYADMPAGVAAHLQACPRVLANEGRYVVGDSMRGYAVDRKTCSEVDAKLYAAADAWLIEHGIADGEEVKLA